MTTVYYLDTAIWLDFYERRGKRGEYARTLIQRIVETDQILLYSDLFRKELKQLGYPPNTIAAMLSMIKGICLRHIHISREQGELAKRIAKQRGVPRGDALHAILARDNMAQLVTTDHDFEKLRDITIAKLPEELI